jgi:hypothetical protein
MLTIPAVANWILNAIVFAILLSLFFYYAAKDTFYYYSIYPMGTVVFFGLVHSLQLKVGFLHHQWNYINDIGMGISLLGLFLYVITYSAVDPPTGYSYFGVGDWVYSEGLFWLFAVFSIPVFLFLIDLISYSFLLFAAPSNEMIFRENDLKNVFQDNKYFSIFENSYSKTKDLHPSGVDISDVDADVEQQREPSTEIRPVAASTRL